MGLVRDPFLLLAERFVQEEVQYPVEVQEVQEILDALLIQAYPVVPVLQLFLVNLIPG